MKAVMSGLGASNLDGDASCLQAGAKIFGYLGENETGQAQFRPPSEPCGLSYTPQWAWAFEVVTVPNIRSGQRAELRLSVGSIARGTRIHWLAARYAREPQEKHI